MKTKIFLANLIAAMVVLVAATHAELITPASYTAHTGGEVDDTGKQLIDKEIGVDYYEIDLGHGPSYEWVGWQARSFIKFTFNTAVTINQVLIGFNRREEHGIYLPKLVTINRKTFNLKQTEIDNVMRGFLKFDGPFIGPTIDISLTGDDYRWIYVDEIQFQQGQPDGTFFIGGSVTNTGLTNVICKNVTTGQSVTLKRLKGVNSWDCAAAGLLTRPGEIIKETLTGTIKTP